MVAMATLAGGGGRSMASLYYNFIRIHASWMRGGSELRRDSTADPDLAALQYRSSWMLALIALLRVLEFRWSPLWHAVILVSIRRHVSVDIYAWRRCYLLGGLGMPPRSSANRRSNPTRVVGGWMGKFLRFLRYRKCAEGMAPHRHPRTN